MKNTWNLDDYFILLSLLLTILFVESKTHFNVLEKNSQLVRKYLLKLHSFFSHWDISCKNNNKIKINLHLMKTFMFLILNI